MFLLKFLTMLTIFTILFIITAKEYLFNKLKSIPKRLIVAIILLTIFISITVIYPNQYSIQHGNNELADKKETNPISIIYKNINMPNNLYNGHIPDNSTLIFYRYDCDTCVHYLPKIKKLVQNKQNVYFVPTRIEENKKILEIFDITEVPSAVHVKNVKYFKKFKYIDKHKKLLETNVLLSVKQNQNK